MRIRIVLVGALTLVLGFAVAQGTGARWLGGLVLVLGGAVAAVLGWRFAGAIRAAASVAVFVVAFVVSHPLGRAIGAWPSVLVVTGAAGLAAYAILRARPDHSLGSGPASAARRVGA